MSRRAPLIVLALCCALAGLVPITASADTPPTVSISADRPIYLSGATEHITVVVQGTGSGMSLRLSAIFPHDITKVLEQSSAYDDTFHFTYTVYVNHAIRAEVISSSNQVVVTKLVWVPESANLTTAAKSGYLGYSGAYAVFPTGSSPVFRSQDLTGRLAPRCLRHVVQRRFASGWSTVLTSACVAERATVVVWRWAHQHPSGVRFRVRATFAGDMWNRPNHAPWSYFEFR